MIERDSRKPTLRTSRFKAIDLAEQDQGRGIVDPSGHYRLSRATLPNCRTLFDDLRALGRSD